MVALYEKLCPWLAPTLADLERTAEAGRLGHAWLLTGAEGLGKLNLALVFADRLLRGSVGARPPAPFGPTEIVAAMRDRRVPADHHPDLHMLAPEEDKKTIAVEQIRVVTEALTLKSLKGGAKCVVIEPAEAMTVAAANALLKSLEEPTPATYLLLVSHRPGRLPATIRSRCQTLVVRGPDRAALDDWLGGEAAAGESRAPRPLVAAERISEEYINIYSKLESDINEIYHASADPQAVAGQWMKLDQALVLDWLVEQISGVLRLRFGTQGRNSFTDRTGPLADNAWDLLSNRALFEQLRKTEALRDQLGSGVNAELGLKVLLLGFIPATR